nr:inactive ubiquitin carboxyl-terminal hydrolase MINDY-4B isoform X5 [Anas platyrhynchos]
MPTQEGFQVLSNANATAFPPLLLWSSSPAGLPFLNALPMPLFYFLIYILFCSLEITTTTHQALRKVLFGDASHIFSHDWAQAHFRFREPHSDLAYALEADKGGTRAILMAVQGNIIKYLLFVRNTEYTHLERLCKISQKEQGEALAAALADSLWAAGEGREATVCLISAATHFVPTTDYKADNFTERIQLFNFCEKAAAQKFIFDHINCFKSEGSKGLILFLYSLLFSRTLERVQNDLGGTTPHLLESSCGNVICTQALLQVVLAGSACPSHRCEVGFLRWSREEAGHHLPPVGSVLKTPKFPIWLCSINGMHGVLFSTNRLLLSDWKMEHVFHLYFYNGQRGQTRTAHLTVGEHSDEPRGHRAAGVTYRRAWSCVCIVLCVSAYIHSPAEQCTCTDTDICIQRVCVSVPKSKVLLGALKPHRPWAVRVAPRSSEGTLRKGVPCSPGTAATSTSSTQPFGSPFTVAFKNKKPEKHHTKAKSAGKRGEGRFPVTVRSMAAAEAACTCAELRPPNMLQGSVSPPPDTHSHHWEEGRPEATSSPGKRSPSLEMAIRTRWPGASVSWNGTDPFF